MPRRRATTSPATSPKRSRRVSGDRHVLHDPAEGGSRALRDTLLGGSDQAGRRMHVSDETFHARNTVLKDVESKEECELRPKSLELHLVDNRKAHHTSEYEQEELIVRRGQGFKVTVTFDREFNREADTIIIQLTAGSRPQASKDTLLRLPVTDQTPTTADDWYATLGGATDKSVDIHITPAFDAIIGRYQVFVETQTQGGRNKTFTNRHTFQDTVCVIFNPWCQDDQVYMETQSHREEYVLNETGRIWQGTRRSHQGDPWVFGQFEDVALEAVLYLMDKAELSEGARSNPTLVIRCLSAMVNHEDDAGVLYGRWTDTYPKSSTEPWAWTGSVAILEEFMRTKKPVKYGQCWVFSGLVTTLLRAVGIPTRSVTNFESAHDTDASMTIDYHWNVDDEPETDYNDSVWNFHVWNESWFKRPDLPEGYDGWQAHDATPQELSDGVMRCGPCPLKAIKEGQVYFPYDTGFVFSEVNGDMIHWLVKDDGTMEYLSKKNSVIGAKISTKAVGSNRREDLTSDYKYRNGSKEERDAVRRAFKYSSRRHLQVYDIPEPDVTFDLETPKHVSIGDDLEVSVLIQNTSSEVRNVNARLTAVLSYYTGVPSTKIGVSVYTENLEPGEKRRCSMTITPEEYSADMKPDSIVTMYLKGRVIETKRSYAHVESFQVSKPGLVIEVPERVAIGEEFEVIVTFNNPLKEKLTGSVLHIEAAGITRPMTRPHKKDIQPSEEFSHYITLFAKRAGNREIDISYSSDQLSGLKGSAELYVSYST